MIERALQDLCPFWKTLLSQMLKKQHIVTLSISEAEYVADASSICHAIQLKNLLKELGLSKKTYGDFIDNKLAMALAKNPAFHD